MNFRVRVARHIEEIGQEAWDQCSRGRSFSSYRWFSFCQAILSDSPAIHIQVSNGEDPIARASFWLERSDALPIPARVQPLARAAIRRWPLCVCRSPVANRSGLVLPEPPQRDEAMRAINNTIGELARKENVSFVLYDYLDGAADGLRESTAGFAWMEVPDPGTSLAMHWIDFQQYLESLGKTAWKDYRRHVNRANEMGLEITRHTRPPKLDEALPLIRAVEEHHQNAPVRYVQSVLENFGMVDGVWIEAREEGRLVGCGLLLVDGDEMIATLLGLDYQVKYVYFQIIYEAIRCAIEKGVRVLHAGSGAYELKRRLGFVLEPNNHIAYAGSGLVFASLSKIGARF